MGEEDATLVRVRPRVIGCPPEEGAPAEAHRFGLTTPLPFYRRPISFSNLGQRGWWKLRRPKKSPQPTGTNYHVMIRLYKCPLLLEVARMLSFLPWIFLNSPLSNFGYYCYSVRGFLVAHGRGTRDGGL